MKIPQPQNEIKRCTACNSPFEAHHHLHQTPNGIFHTNCYKKVAEFPKEKEEWEAEFDKLWPSNFFTEKSSTIDEIRQGEPIIKLIDVKSFIRSLLHSQAEEILKEVRGLRKSTVLRETLDRASMVDNELSQNQDFNFNSALILVEEMLLAKMK